MTSKNFASSVLRKFNVTTKKNTIARGGQWCFDYMKKTTLYLRRRRAAKPARASRESVAVVVRILGKGSMVITLSVYLLRV